MLSQKKTLKRKIKMTVSKRDPMECRVPALRECPLKFKVVKKDHKLRMFQHSPVIELQNCGKPT